MRKFVLRVVIVFTRREFIDRAVSRIAIKLAYELNGLWHKISLPAEEDLFPTAFDAPRRPEGVTLVEWCAGTHVLAGKTTNRSTNIIVFWLRICLCVRPFHTCLLTLRPFR